MSVSSPPTGAAAEATIDSVAGGAGSGLALQLAQTPTQLAIGGGSLYIADSSHQVIRRVDLATGTEAVVVGGREQVPWRSIPDGPVLGVSVAVEPSALATEPDGSLLFASNYQIGRLRTDGTVVRVAGRAHDVPEAVDSGDGLDARDASFTEIGAITVVGDGSVLVGTGGLIRRIGPDNVVSTVAVGSAAAIAAEPTGGFAFVEDNSGDVVRVDASGVLRRDAIVMIDDTHVGSPRGLARLSDGTLLVADWQEDRVVRVFADNTGTAVAGTGVQGSTGDGGQATSAQLYEPVGLAANADGSWFVADTGNNVVRKVAQNGKISRLAGNGSASTTTGDGAPAVDAQLLYAGDVLPWSDGGFLVSTQGSIRRVSASGAMSRFAGNDPGGPPAGDGGAATAATFWSIPDLASDGAGGVFLIDFMRVRRINRLGIVTTVAGTGASGSSGDGGPAADATFGASPGSPTSGPLGLVDDGTGGFYVSDTWNRTVRHVDQSGTIRLYAGGTDEFGSPTGLARTVSGDLLVADSGVVRRIRNSDRALSVAAGGGSRQCPPNPVDASAVRFGWAYGVDARSDDSFLVADAAGGCVVWVHDGVAVALAGQGTAHKAAGDGAAAHRAFLDSVTRIASSPDGSVLLSGSRVRRLSSVETPPPATAPSAPRNVTASSATYGTIGASWQPPASDGGRPLLEYLIGSSNAGQSPSSALPSTTTGLVRGLTDGHWYRARVIARTIAGDSEPSPWTDYVVAGPPGTAPTESKPTVVPPPPTTIPVSSTTTSQPPVPTVPSPPRTVSGYRMLSEDGSVYAFGDAAWLGNAPVGASTAQDLEATSSGGGYWIADDVGHVFAFGDAPYFGGSPRLGAGERVTSLSRTATSAGYWLFTTAGRVFTFGDASFYGDMTGIRLNGPVLDSIPTASGRGYYLVASDGGIFTFGDARFEGSMGQTSLNAPVQSLVPDSDGSGYWLVASDGGIFSFDADFYGSMGHVQLNRPVSGMVGFRRGYLMVAEDGGIFTFGEAVFSGSLGDRPPQRPITSVAASS
jgi:hypothetical protein